MNNIDLDKKIFYGINVGYSNGDYKSKPYTFDMVPEFTKDFSNGVIFKDFKIVASVRVKDFKNLWSLRDMDRLGMDLISLVLSKII